MLKENELNVGRRHANLNRENKIRTNNVEYVTYHT